MPVSAHRRSIAIFITLGACLVALAVTLNVGWILLNWREGLQLVFGVLFFLLIIAGMVLNTVFLVREIRRNEQHDTFINAVTHELKTPVASIRLYLETLQTREVDEARRQEFYTIMLADADRLLHTIEQVLRTGRMTRRQLHISNVDLQALAQECVVLARRRNHLGENQLWVAEPPPAVTTLLADADELRAAISNLVDNAIKYSGDHVAVEVALLQPDPGSLAVRVTDHGVGIPQQELKRIFKRFYRIPGSVAVRVKGTGLGLFIVRAVAKRHGGRAFATSAGPGQGSQFTLQLPITAPAGPQESA
ncbi:MAG: sensor histidine kinase [Terriglobales bacterium]